jgi:dolichyl-diphosphooligosaccharide--protein glycosyltransferase
MDLQFLIFVFPAGVVLCFRELRDEHVFVIIYAVMASYFAGVMVRLMLALTPVVCVASAVAFSSLLDTFVDASEPTVVKESKNEPAVPSAAPNALAPRNPSSQRKAKRTAPPPTPSTPAASTPSPISAAPKLKGIFGFDVRLMVVLNTLGMLSFFVFHCTWVTSTAYSSPSVVLASSNPDGSQHLIDDFREAYYWIRQNTPQDAVVMSWWDYGYQIAGMADRTTLVDNNTWNNSQLIAMNPLSKIRH